MGRAALALLIALPLAACNGDGGTNASLSVADNGSNFSITLPRIAIDEADFDVNGVKLYPGSTIRDFNLDATDRTGDRDDAKVTLAFDAPAPLSTVQTWFRDNLAKQGFKTEAKGNGFAGTTKDGEAFTLDLTADGDAKTKGRMHVRG